MNRFKKERIKKIKAAARSSIEIFFIYLNSTSSNDLDNNILEEAILRENRAYFALKERYVDKDFCSIDFDSIINSCIREFLKSRLVPTNINILHLAKYLSNIKRRIFSKIDGLINVSKDDLVDFNSLFDINLFPYDISFSFNTIFNGLLAIEAYSRMNKLVSSLNTNGIKNPLVDGLKKKIEFGILYEAINNECFGMFLSYYGKDISKYPNVNFNNIIVKYGDDIDFDGGLLNCAGAILGKLSGLHNISLMDFDSLYDYLFYKTWLSVLLSYMSIGCLLRFKDVCEQVKYNDDGIKDDIKRLVLVKELGKIPLIFVKEK